jgi:CheY-like chemotaxis protein
MTIASTASPIVLVVEDDEYGLQRRVDELAQVGLTAIGVGSSDEAIREMRASPGVDFVLTDIRLGPATDDKSGVSLAKYVKQTDPDVEVGGYSAYFGPEELKNDVDTFDYVWPKGLEGVIDEIVEVCRASATEHRKQRAQTAFDVHVFLRRGYEEAHPEVEVLRELRLGGGFQAPVEAALNAAGYRLKLIDATRAGLTQPIIVWLSPADGGVEAEIYGQPALYAFADTDEGAIAEVVQLLHLYAADSGPGSTPTAGPARSLTDFLRKKLAAEGEPE